MGRQMVNSWASGGVFFMSTGLVYSPCVVCHPESCALGHFSSQSPRSCHPESVTLRLRHLSRQSPAQLCWPPRGSSAEGSARCVPSAPCPPRQPPLLGMGKKNIKILTDTLHTDTLERKGSACTSNCCEDEKHLAPLFRPKIAKIFK